MKNYCKRPVFLVLTTKFGVRYEGIGHQVETLKIYY